jgi:hypothetical protein
LSSLLLPHAATSIDKPATNTRNASVGRHLSQPKIVFT